MELFAYFILIIIIVLFIVVLPLLSGVGSFKIDKSIAKRQERSKRDPNVLKFKLKEQKDKSNSDNDSIGISSSTFKKTGKFEIDSKTGLKKRVIGKYVQDDDPNTFDFDVDELINEDEEEEKRELQQRRSKFQGREYEANEDFV